MASRRNIPPAYNEHFRQASQMVHPAALHPIESLPPPQHLENKLMSQEAEIEQLARDNHKLASGHLALRQDLVAAQQEAEKLREHIRSIQTEGDIEIRILSDKIGKMEADIRAGENIKNELQEAHIEAQRLMTAKLELTAKVQQATKELENFHADFKKRPEMHAELDSLRQEHQRLRKTFEYEKGVNIEKVEQMKILEKNLISMAEEVERLHAVVLNAEKRASVPIPYGGPYMNSDNLYPSPFHGNAGFVDSFGRAHLPAVGVAAPAQAMNPYASDTFAAGPPIMSGLETGAAATSNPPWGGMYGASHSHAQR